MGDGLIFKGVLSHDLLLPVLYWRYCCI